MLQICRRSSCGGMRIRESVNAVVLWMASSFSDGIGKDAQIGLVALTGTCLAIMAATILITVWRTWQIARDDVREHAAGLVDHTNLEHSDDAAVKMNTAADSSHGDVREADTDASPWCDESMMTLTQQVARLSVTAHGHTPASPVAAAAVQSGDAKLTPIESPTVEPSEERHDHPPVVHNPLRVSMPAERVTGSPLRHAAAHAILQSVDIELATIEASSPSHANVAESTTSQSEIQVSSTADRARDDL